MNRLKAIKKEIRRLEKARDKVEREGLVIMGRILKKLNEVDPGWIIKPTGQDEIIVFMNGLESISLNLETGAIDPVAIFSEIGKRGLTMLGGSRDLTKSQ